MKRGIFMFVSVLALGALTCGIFWWQGQQQSTVRWLQKEFRLNDEQTQQAAEIHKAFLTDCMDLCDQIRASDERLQALVQSSNSMTPEIQAAIAESDRVRTQCRTNMLGHYYQMATILPADQREKYLDLVLPTVVRPGDLSTAHTK